MGAFQACEADQTSEFLPRKGLRGYLFVLILPNRMELILVSVSRFNEEITPCRGLLE